VVVLMGALERRLESANRDTGVFELSYIDWWGYVSAVLVAIGWHKCLPSSTPPPPPTSSSPPTPTSSSSSISASGRVDGVLRGGDMRILERRFVISKARDATQKPGVNAWVK